MKSQQDFGTWDEWLDYYRHYAAAMAMQGLLANNTYNNPYEKSKMVTVSALAKTSTDYADALIKALNQTPTPLNNTQNKER